MSQSYLKVAVVLTLKHGDQAPAGFVAILPKSGCCSDTLCRYDRRGKYRSQSYLKVAVVLTRLAFVERYGFSSQSYLKVAVVLTVHFLQQLRWGRVAILPKSGCCSD